jgi:hypothetical protein
MYQSIKDEDSSSIHEFLISMIHEDSRFKILINKRYECYLNETISSNFDRVIIPNNGNCLFIALSKIVYPDGNENENGLLVRDQILRYMNEHKNILSKIKGVGSLDGRLHTMRDPTKWGGEEEIYTAMLLYDRPIVVLNMSGEEEQKFKNFSEMLSLFNPAIYLYSCSTRRDRSPQHFELLIPKQPTSDKKATSSIKKRRPPKKGNNDASAGDSNLKKYLKYKQKYLLLKNKK